MKLTSILMLALTASVNIYAVVPPTEYNDNPPYNFHGETDNTDIYAIPLDNSEEDQDEELESFENFSKDRQKSK